ncbi:hypothetical protein HOLleu_07870 [Holothuria leucospilota]|uniref:Uncharacterized protein n=1 Tax=Holothuria leucospilota TaxID=206669 RepID=A0A9Q1CHZ8_HOLLE|nr:hypothetical protein HOLleu_07870 [Holothuria leucospilota]
MKRKSTDSSSSQAPAKQRKIAVKAVPSKTVKKTPAKMKAAATKAKQGARLNPTKTKGLRLGKWRSKKLPFAASWVDDAIKINGIWFGYGSPELLTWNEKVDLVEARLKDFGDRHISLLGKVLLDIFNGIWWEATIILIAKPGKDLSSATNYRPISLTRCLCQTFERIINARLVRFLETNRLITSYQSSF